MKIAIIGRDIAFGGFLVNALEATGHHAHHKRHGVDLLLSHRAYDAAVVDVDQLDTDGWQLLRQLRMVSAVPVIVLSAHTDERTIVRALQLGADDCMQKPPRIAVLEARLQTVARRGKLPSPPREQVVVTRDLHVDLAARVVRMNRLPLALTFKEFELVRILVDRRGFCVSREQLMDAIWGNTTAATSRALSTHMATLRAKLARPELITTIRGRGYRWEPEVAPGWRSHKTSHGAHGNSSITAAKTAVLSSSTAT